MLPVVSSSSAKRVDDDDDEKYQKRNKKPSSDPLPSWHTLLLIGVIVWQVFTIGRFAVYKVHLSESYERHLELQTALSDAQEALARMHNSTRECNAQEEEHARELEAAERERLSLERQLDDERDRVTVLNETATSREIALREEQARRYSLEGSVSTLKEQMNLMQGQLVTAQQQQGTLHGAGGKHGKHHS